MKTIEIDRYSLREGLTPEEFYEWFLKIKKDINRFEKDYSNIRISFRSTMAPYEDFLDDAEIYFSGDRPLTKQEQHQKNREADVEALAKKLNCSFYEANVVMQLQSSGKLKDL